MNPNLPPWTTIGATCTHPPPNWQVNPARITVPEPYIYVTNNTGNHAILERCCGSLVQFYADDTMPEDAVGCVLVAHVEKGSAAEAWQCFIDGRLEGGWGVVDKAAVNGVGKKGVGIVRLAMMGLTALSVVLGGGGVMSGW